MEKSPMIFKNTVNQLPKQQSSRLKKKLSIIYPAALLISTLIATHAVANSNSIKFHDIATDPDSGLSYEREPSPELVEILNAFNAKGVITLPDDLIEAPSKSEGSPGIAVLDYDGDGDQDIYITNGPGKPNSLFKNMLTETGTLTFVDVGARSGAAATEQDSMGVCYGDIDNDGDQDLYVLGRAEPNRLFENQGDGTFIDVTESAGMGAGNFTSQVCAMGDINGDGLLDIGIGNTFDMRSNAALNFEPFALNEPDQLFLNKGSNIFEDVSESSGIRNLSFPLASGAPPGAAGMTLSMSMVDYDQDGDVDIIIAQDQAAIPDATLGGIDRGFVHILENDGTGKFTDVTEEKQMFRYGAWMGLDFGDLNCDGLIDMFVSNLGDYFVPFINQPYKLGSQSSRLLLGLADGSFADPGVGNLMATPFGWGTAIFDYDNDGDQDIVFHGGANMATTLEASNPGVILNNQNCSANFELDKAAMSETNHSRRAVFGVVVADLNRDGFGDIISVSSYNTPEPNPLIPAPPTGSSEFDSTAFMVPTWLPGDAPNQLVFNPSIVKTKGSLSVEINSGDNNNGWAVIELLGAVGITENGHVNRNGIGAVVTFEPENGPAVIKPLLAGSSHASQNSLELLFGMGEAEKGTVEVLWPGGVRNRLYNVARGERILLPEIPCSYDASWEKRSDYKRCVKSHLNQLKNDDIIASDHIARLKQSAMRAYKETHEPNISSAFPFKPNYAEVLGSRMHYVDVGEGDPFLLIHGNPTSSYLWRNIIPELVQLGRVIAVDLIGMGKSDKPAIDYRFADHKRYLEEFINQLDLRNITMVVHDWGSALGFNYAAHHEDYIKGIVFMEAMLLPPPSFDVFGPAKELFQAFRTPGIGEQLIINENFFVENMLPSLTERSFKMAEMQHYRKPFKDVESRFVLWRWPNELPIAGEPAENAQMIMEYNAWLKNTDKPKLMFYSKTGFTTPPSLATWAQLNLKNLATYRLPSGLHYFQEDYPDLISQRIKKWYQSL